MSRKHVLHVKPVDPSISVIVVGFYGRAQWVQYNVLRFFIDKVRQKGDCKSKAIEIFASLTCIGPVIVRYIDPSIKI